jgi:hypothetical protein
MYSELFKLKPLNVKFIKLQNDVNTRGNKSIDIQK